METEATETVTWTWRVKNEDITAFEQEFENKRESLHAFLKQQAMALEQRVLLGEEEEAASTSSEVMTAKRLFPQQLATLLPVRRTRVYHHTPAPARPSMRKIMDQVRKWATQYDGGSEPSPIAFLDRIEELAVAYKVDVASLPRAMPQLLTARALTWFRVNNQNWGSWDAFKSDFLEFFLPTAIDYRKQRPREAFHDYMLDIQRLMTMAHWPEHKQLLKIYRNSRRDYQLYIRPTDFTTLRELNTLAKKYEDISREEPAATTRPNRIREARPLMSSAREERLPMETATEKNNQQTRCRNCGQDGHGRRECRNPQVLFCWVCGRSGIRTKECCRRKAKRGRAAPKTTGSAVRQTDKPVSPAMSYLTCKDDHVSATVKIGQHTETAVIDTGATRSFICPNLVKELGLVVETKYRDVLVRMANGTIERVRNIVRQEVALGEGRYELELLVLESGSADILLGMDFLAKAGTTLICGSERVSWSEETMANKAAQEVQIVSSTLVPPDQEDDIRKFLAVELEEFNKLKGPSNITKHKIVMTDERPIEQRHYAKNPAMQKIISEKVDELIEEDFIEPSNSPYSSPAVLMKKKTADWELYMDYRQLNSQSSLDAYPLPKIHHILNRLKNARYISSLDLRNGYWQIPVDEDSRKYTAFAIEGRGLFQWRVMPFELHSAPATFQRALEKVIGPDMQPVAFAYLGDIIVTGVTLEEHMLNVMEVFRRLRQANLKINTENCKFFLEEIKYLGHIITNAGILHTDPEKITAIQAIQPPRNVREVRGVLEIFSWYQRFVPEFAKVTQPLTSLLKKGRHWRWTKEHRTAFETLKKRLLSFQVLVAFPDFNQKFCLQTDVCDDGLGAVLTQELDGHERVICYASRQVNTSERNYSPSEKECVAIVWAIRKMRPYLEGYRFSVITGHHALKSLSSIDSQSERISRWALELQTYSFEVVVPGHRDDAPAAKGKQAAPRNPKRAPKATINNQPGS